ncbi:MAG TPA: ribosome recycling factor, partial [Gammaproteobacteria bacterium]|nr:ribosome recycling factor [Gammaproteobacteria bacterium]
MINDIKKTAEQRMQRGLEALKEELKRLRTGRAHTGLLEHVTVEYYGSRV